MASERATPSQFALPRGLGGWFVGWFLALSNAGMNAFAVESLNVPPDARVLEVGFGPGVAIRRLCIRLPHGKVCGVDPSDTMLRQALRRNRLAVRSGQVDLRIGTASDLPWEDRSFDGVLSLNNVLLWDTLDRGMREVGRVVKPGGQLIIGVHHWAARGQLRSKGAALDVAEQEVRRALEAAGFSGVEGRRSRFWIGSAVFLFARRLGRCTGYSNGPPDFIR